MSNKGLPSNINEGIILHLIDIAGYFLSIFIFIAIINLICKRKRLLSKAQILVGTKNHLRKSSKMRVQVPRKVDFRAMLIPGKQSIIPINSSLVVPEVKVTTEEAQDATGVESSVIILEEIPIIASGEGGTCKNVAVVGGTTPRINVGTSLTSSVDTNEDSNATTTVTTTTTAAAHDATMITHKLQSNTVDTCTTTTTSTNDHNTAANITTVDATAVKDDHDIMTKYHLETSVTCDVVKAPKNTTLTHKSASCPHINHVNHNQPDNSIVEMVATDNDENFPDEFFLMGTQEGKAMVTDCITFDNLVFYGVEKKDDPSYKADDSLFEQSWEDEQCWQEGTDDSTMKNWDTFTNLANDSDQECPEVDSIPSISCLFASDDDDLVLLGNDDVSIDDDVMRGQEQPHIEVPKQDNGLSAAVKTLQEHPMLPVIIAGACLISWLVIKKAMR